MKAEKMAESLLAFFASWFLDGNLWENPRTNTPPDFRKSGTVILGGIPQRLPSKIPESSMTVISWGIPGQIPPPIFENRDGNFRGAFAISRSDLGNCWGRKILAILALPCLLRSARTRRRSRSPQPPQPPKLRGHPWKLQTKTPSSHAQKFRLVARRPRERTQPR